MSLLSQMNKLFQYREKKENYMPLLLQNLRLVCNLSLSLRPNPTENLYPYRDITQKSKGLQEIRVRDTNLGKLLQRQKTKEGREYSTKQQVNHR